VGYERVGRRTHTDIPLFTSTREKTKQKFISIPKIPRNKKEQTQTQTHPLRQNNPQHKHRQESSGAQPSIKHMRGPAIKGLLVLAVQLRVLGSDRVEWTA
jgi:hypothetical protein